MDADVRVACIDIGASSGRATKHVAHGVLDPKCCEVQAPERALDRGYGDPDATLRDKPVGPPKRAGGIVDVRLVPIVALSDSPQDAAGDTAFEIDPAAQAVRSREPNATVDPRHVGRAEGRQFRRESGFEAARAGGEKVLCWTHGPLRQRASA